MRIATEIGWGHKPGGARRVALRVLEELLTLYPDNRYDLYSNSRYDALEKFAVAQHRFSKSALIPQVIWDQFVFPHVSVPMANRRLQPDVMHCTNNIVPFWGKTPVVVTIHDMTPFILPESFRFFHGEYQRAYFKFAAKKARKIITVSNNSKKDICKILGVDDQKVVVAPLAVDLMLSQRATSSAGSQKEDMAESPPFILYTGAIHPRKNLGRILRCFAKLKKEKGIPHKLIVAGSFRWMPKTGFDESDYAAVRDDIIFKGWVSDAELAALYSTCSLFVWPSLYEGFGLPVLEAMSFGAPVVTSNCSSMPEVAGDAALLVDPYSIEEIFEAMWKVIDDPELALQLRAKSLKQAGKFSWRKTAETIYQVYKSV